jgi:hypothetical protein
MNNNEKLKMLKGNNKGIFISFIIFIIGVILIIAGFLIDDSNSKTPKDYGTLISNKQDNTNEYVKVNIGYLPYLFATSEDEYGEKNYYIIFDTEGFPYIARLTDVTYNVIKVKYDNDEEISYEIEGYLFKQEEKLKELAMDAHKELFTDSLISEANYEMYFGKSYLDETMTPSSDIVSIMIGIGVGTSILGFAIFIVFIVYKIRFKKNIKKYDKYELESELLSSDALYFKKENICLTNKYIISTLKGLDVIKYEDILWAYYENRNLNYSNIGKYLIVGLKNKKLIELAYSFNDEEVLIEIMNKIKMKNKDILIGYSKENQNKYNELIKKP